VLLGAGRPQPGEGRQTSEGGTAYLPLYLAVLPLPAGGPLDPVAAGYEYLCGYTRRAIRGAERRAGPLSGHEDLIPQGCRGGRAGAGPPQEAFPRLLERAPAEMRLLRDAVNRVIARTIYQRRKHPHVIDATRWPAPSRPSERDWAEFRADCERGTGNLTAQE